MAQRYRVRVDDGIGARQRFLAGPDPVRLSGLHTAWSDRDVRAIFCARGGYGCMRLLPELDPDLLRRDPKALVGFSDITALHCWALVCAGVRGIHGPNVSQLGQLPPADVAWLFRLLEETRVSQLAPALAQAVAPMELSPVGAAMPARVEGPLIGGNLCLLAHLLGTPYAPPYESALLFCEEVFESPYRLDREFTHLGLAGALGRVAGAIVGDIERPGTIDDRTDDWVVVDERLRAYGVAGVKGFPLGHGKRNLALPFAGRAAISHDDGYADGQIRMTLLEAAVA